MTNEEIVTHQANQRKFRESEIGKLFNAYHHALINYWNQDGNDNVSDRRLRELDDKARKTEEEFVGRLMADYGVI